MVVRLPVAGVPVPVEPRPHALPSDPEVVPHLVLNLLERRAALGPFADEVRALRPRDPLALLRAAGLGGRHFLEELVVQTPI